MVSKEYEIPLDYDPRLKVYARDDSPVRYWWRYYLPTGELIRRSASNDKKIAKDNGKVKVQQLLRGIFDEKEKEKLGHIKRIRMTIEEGVDFYNSITAKYKSGHTKRNEATTISSIFMHFKEKRQRKYIDEVTEEDVEHIIDYYEAEGYSIVTVNDYLVYIKKVFNKLMEKKKVDKNPAQDLKPIPAGKSRKARRVYVPKKHLDLMLETPIPSSVTFALRAVIILIVNTGMRIGEVLHLEWPEIKIEKRRIELREKPYCPTQFGIGWKPKWGVERDVPLNETALWILESQPRRETFGFIPGQKDSVPAQFVFPRLKKIGRKREGNQKLLWVRCDEVRHIWNDLLEKAGLRYDGVLLEEFGIPIGSYSIHDLRRTFRHYGTDIALLTENQTSEIMGNDLEVNRDHYGGVIGSEIQRKIENLPFDYRDTSPSNDVGSTKEGRRKHLRMLED